jgi:hypothetical protein
MAWWFQLLTRLSRLLHPPDRDCDEVNGDNFTVKPPDPHGFDGDGDGSGARTDQLGPRFTFSRGSLPSMGLGIRHGPWHPLQN